MIREQNLMADVVKKIGPELDEYISTFHNCDLWHFKENQLMVNKTFKKVLSIIADYNLTSAEEVLKGAYRLIHSNNESMLSILSYLGDLHLKNGSDSLLNRAMIFCYALYELSLKENKKPTEVLEVIYKYDLITIKESWFAKLKYKVGYYNYPFNLEVNNDGLMLVSILSGKNVEDTIKYVLMLYNIEY